MTTNRRGASWTRLLLVGLSGLLGLLAAPGCGPTDDAGAELVRVPEDAPSLTVAHEQVAPGGMILISPGVYEEQLLVTKDDVTVRGVDRNGVIIDGGGVRPYGVVAIADGVRVQNLTVRNATFYGVLVTGLYGEGGPSAHTASGYEPFDPDEFPPVNRFAVNFVTAHNNGLYGIYAFDAQHGEITDSYASGSADSGYYVGQCADCDILVTRNVAERNAVGFENANASDSVSVVGNRFSDNRVGLTLLSNYQEAFTPQRANLVAGNVIADNISTDSPRQEAGGFALGIGISGGRDNVIANNLISGHPRAGVLLENTEDLAAIGNALTGNGFAHNGVDVANVSAERAPAAGNCVEPVAAETFLPAALGDACAAGADQPAATSDELPGPAAPPGVSFLQVAQPLPQPNMPHVEVQPGPLPASVDHPSLADIALPLATLLAELTGHAK